MGVKSASDETFNEDVKEHPITVVDFWAPWCGPCRAFAPVFEASAEANPEVGHLKVNVDENPALGSFFQVQSIPTTVFIREDVVVGAIPGAMNAAQLSEILDQVKDLDMDEVRKQAQ